MATESDLRRYQAQAGKLRSDISKASSTVATKRKKAADARGAASRSKTSSTIRMKNSEAEKAEREAITAESQRATLEKRLAETEDKIVKARADVDKKRQDDQKRSFDSLRRDTERAARQFTIPVADPPRRLGESAVAVPHEQLATHDVFLSHASEDKEAIARPLKDALESRGLTVWFDEIKIKVGQSIRQEIEKGIATARFGVVIISPDFFKKQWTRAELDALFARKMASGESMILPVWHHVSKDEVLAQSPLLAGILALNSSIMTVEEMADQITEVAAGSS
jgi:molecular chaperone GrpE (heat shock protein)